MNYRLISIIMLLFLHLTNYGMQAELELVPCAKSAVVSKLKIDNQEAFRLELYDSKNQRIWLSIHFEPYQRNFIDQLTREGFLGVFYTKPSASASDIANTDQLGSIIPSLLLKERLSTPAALMIDTSQLGTIKVAEDSRTKAVEGSLNKTAHNWHCNRFLSFCSACATLVNLR